jgi:hypothetical protein
MSQATPAGMPTQALAAAPMSQPMLAQVPQNSAPVTSTGADSDAYARARAAANVWQTNRNIAAE